MAPDDEIDLNDSEEFDAEIDPEDGDFDVEDVYQWTSFNGCEICDAMAGEHVGYEPERPHPFCECDISLISDSGNASSTPGTCYSPIRINWESISLEPGSSTATLNASYDIQCLDAEGEDSHGESGDESVEFDIGFDMSGALTPEAASAIRAAAEAARDEIRDRLEQRAREICKDSCKEPSPDPPGGYV